MLPTPENLLVFLLALWPLTFLQVVWHEAGHKLAARLVGMPVLAWGVGFQQPRFRLHYGNNFFYIGRPLFGGLTLFCRPLFEPRRWAEFFTILGGPLATAVGLGLGIAAWKGGIQSDLLTAWIYLSAWLCLASWIPYTSHKAGLTFDNDARLLWNLLVHGVTGRARPLGASVGTQATIATLLDQIGNRPGAAHVRLAAANLALALGAIDVARRWQQQTDGVDLNAVVAGHALRAYLSAAIAMEAEQDDAGPLIEIAATACQSDATALFLLDLYRQGVRRKQGHDIQSELVALRDRALAAKRGPWLAAVELLSYEWNPAADEAELDALLARNQEHLPDASRASMLAIAIERLAQAGKGAEAQSRFAAAEQALQQVASFIADPEIRAAYLARAAAPLERAHALFPEQIPQFQVNTPSAVESNRPRPILTRVAWLLSLGLASAGSTAFVCVNYLNRFPPQATRGSFVLLILSGALVCVIATLVALVRREGRAATNMLSCALAFLAAIAATNAIERANERTHTEMREVLPEFD